jgi:hypothetical protein
MIPFKALTLLRRTIDDAIQRLSDEVYTGARRILASAAEKSGALTALPPVSLDPPQVEVEDVSDEEAELAEVKVNKTKVN